MQSREDVRVLAGRYELREELARGGMGVVWRAEDTLLGRSVAVKQVLLPHAVRSGERSSLQRRVLREARASAALGHPGIVTVFDVIQEGDEGFIVMELVDSPSLDTVVRERGPLSVEQAIGIAREAAEILAEAHARGVIHRDVKPGNVIVTSSGHVKLADFGISSIKDDPSMTTSGELLGSPSFMSPEQARGERVGPETDVWGLGATLYFAVEGVPPFDAGQAVPTLNAVVHEEPRPMDRAGALAPVISALLAKDPAGRPSGAELADMLDAASGSAGGEPTTPLDGSIAERTAPLAPAAEGEPTKQLTASGTGTVPGGLAPRSWLTIIGVVAAAILVAVIAFAAFAGDPGPSGGATRKHHASTSQREPSPSSTAPAEVTPAKPSVSEPSPKPEQVKQPKPPKPEEAQPEKPNPGHDPQGNAFGQGNGNG